MISRTERQRSCGLRWTNRFRLETFRSGPSSACCDLPTTRAMVLVSVEVDGAGLSYVEKAGRFVESVEVRSLRPTSVPECWAETVSSSSEPYAGDARARESLGVRLVSQVALPARTLSDPHWRARTTEWYRLARCRRP